MSIEADRLRELLVINRAITSSTSYEEVLELVVQKACAFTKADACMLLLAEPGAPASIAASVGVLAAKGEDLQIVLDERLNARLRERFGLSPDDGIIAVPMVVRGDVRGSLVVVGRHTAESALDVEERAEEEFLLSALADQAAIALGHTAHLRELEAALEAADREHRAREEVLTALSAERSWLRAVIEHSPIAVLLVEGTSGERVTVNAAAEELFGRRILPEAGFMQYAAQICRPDGTPVPLAEVPAIQAVGGEPVRRELAIRNTDGTLVPVLASAAAIRDARSGILGAVVLYQDISALKDLERMREEWTSVVAHDLRQPVNTISLRAHLLARQISGVDPRMRCALDHILTCAQQLDRMIGDLLDSSVLETQRLVLTRSPTEVSSILADTIDRCAAVTAGHAVELLVADDLPWVDIDSGRIEQVLTNLLTNAAKYGAPDTPIEVRAERSGDAIEVTVRNYGPGLESATLGTVFERFQRGQTTKGPKVEGLGLGLYISKGLIEAHGGKIWVESVPGETTTFHFTLPIQPMHGVDHGAAATHH